MPDHIVTHQRTVPPHPEPLQPADQSRPFDAPGEAGADDRTRVAAEASAPDLDVVLTALMPVGSEVIFWSRPTPVLVAAYDRRKRRRHGRRVQVVLGEFPHLLSCELHQIAPAAELRIEPVTSAVVHAIGGIPRTYTLAFDADERGDEGDGGDEDWGRTNLGVDSVVEAEPGWQLVDEGRAEFTMPEFLRPEDALAAAPLVDAVMRWQRDARSRLLSWGADVLAIAAMLVHSGVTVSEDDLRAAAQALLATPGQQGRSDARLHPHPVTAPRAPLSPCAIHPLSVSRGGTRATDSARMKDCAPDGPTTEADDSERT